MSYLFLFSNRSSSLRWVQKCSSLRFLIQSLRLRSWFTLLIKFLNFFICLRNLVIKFINCRLVCPEPPARTTNDRNQAHSQKGHDSKLPVSFLSQSARILKHIFWNWFTCFKRPSVCIMGYNIAVIIEIWQATVALTLLSTNTSWF